MITIKDFCRACLCLSVLFLLGDTARAQTIRMQDIPLIWGDFQSKKPTASRHTAAHIAYALGFGYSAKEITSNRYVVSFETKFTLRRTDSWLNSNIFKKLDSQAQNRLLNHEKGHLIIGLIYYKELTHALDDGQYTGNIKQKLNKKFHKVNNRMDRYNKKYDRKTKHSIHRGKQRKWETRLLKQLNRAYSYAELKQMRF